MSTLLDASLGFAAESTFGTSVTPARWLEYSKEGLDFKPNRVQGGGFRVGSRVARANRRATVTSEAGGSVELDVLTKGLGLWWQMLMGGGSSTLVSGSTYQQLFTLGDTLPSFTLQKGVPRVNADGSATVDPITFTGCTVGDFELSGGADLLKLKTTVDAQAVTTATALAAPSFTTGANLLSFAGATIYGGTLTAPTTTALASGATPIANVKSWSLKVSHGLKADRYLFGLGGKKARQVPLNREVSGKLEVEYSDQAFRDAFLADTPLTLVITYAGGALSTGVETFQAVVPEIRLDGELPKGEGDIAVMSCGFTGLDNLTAAQPLWLVTRTSDAAL